MRNNYMALHERLDLAYMVIEEVFEVTMLV